MSADLLRRAAALMRERATEAGKPWHPYGDHDLPLRSTPAQWAGDMRGYLGGAWGEHAASWHPAVALAVADWLEEAVRTHWTGCPDLGCSELQPAVAVARAYLGETS